MGNPDICVDNLLNDLDSQFLDLYISESFTSAPIQLWPYLKHHHQEPLCLLSCITL